MSMATRRATMKRRLLRPSACLRIRCGAQVLLSSVLLLGVGACGGGGSGGGADPVGGTPPLPSGTGTVSVTVRDALGGRVPGADVGVTYPSVYQGQPASTSRWVTADSNGEFTFADVGSGQIWAGASYETVVNWAGRTTEVSLAPDGHLDLEITIRPNADPTMGVAPAYVHPTQGVWEDGRSLEFSLNLAMVEPIVAIGSGGGFTVRACAPDPVNDAPTFQADCIEGPMGFDAAYSVTLVRQMATRAPSATPFSVALLLDQSRNIVSSDPDDQRLFDIKYFLTNKGPDNRVVLAAFGGNDADSGELSPLPQQPATILPTENPTFTASANGYFATVDSLDTLEGGRSTLFGSIDALLDFTATNAASAERRIVAVLSAGGDDVCGSVSDCRNAERQLVEKSGAKSVGLVTIGLAGASGRDQRGALARLTELTGGVALWVDDPHQMGLVFGALPRVLDGSAPISVLQVRITSPTVGAFQSGRIVMGTLHYESCPFECYRPMDIPFAVRIP